MNKLIVANREIEIKEYRGERVVTAWDIAEVHGRDVKRVNEQFRRNRKKLIEKEDYFILSREEFSESFSATALSKFSNNKEIKLFTESGLVFSNSCPA